MCQDSTGKWRPSERQDQTAEQPLANDVPRRAEITYGGQYDATLTVTRPVNMNNLSLGSLLQSAMNSQRKPFQGSITFTAQLSGTAVTAAVSGTGGIYSRQLSGQVQSGTCHLAVSDNLGTADYTGKCDAKGFSGTFKGVTREGQKYQGRFDTTTTQVVDLDQREREQLAAQKAREAEIAAAEERLRRAPSAGPALTKRLDGYVQTDSRGWAFNHYDSGSMTNVKIVDGSIKSGHYVMRGDYTYNGGSRGWVFAKMAGPKLECIQFHDAILGCRGLRSAAQGQSMRNAAFGLMTGGGGSRGGGRSRDADTADQINQQNQDRHDREQQDAYREQQHADAEAQRAAMDAQYERLQTPNSMGW